MTQGIYEIVNWEDGKATTYVGSSVDIEQRWNSHRSELRRGQHPNTHLQAAWNKYSEEAFVFNMLEEVEDNMLLVMEQEYLDNYFDGGHCYNIARYVEASPMQDRHHTEETKCKMSEAKRGRTFTEEHKRKISQANKGKPKSEEHKCKLSEAKMGYKHTDETKRRMSEFMMGNQYNLGHKHTEEAKRKMSKSHEGNQYNLGRTHTDEARQNMSEAQMGHTVSTATRRKMSEANRGKPKSEEHKRKLSEALKRYYREKAQNE